MRRMHTPSLDRRGFLGVAAGLAGSSLLASSGLVSSGRVSSGLVSSGLLPSGSGGSPPVPAKPLFGISLAQWSLHRTLRKGQLSNLDFPKKAKSFGIHAVEYVNQFFKDKAKDAKYIAELKKRCDGEGVQSLLIMCDGEGALGAKDDRRRKQAVENHHKWVVAAKALGCHSIRVNAQSQGSYDEQSKLAADGLRQLCEFADSHGIYVIVENHGGLSSDGKWLSAVLKKVDHARVGSLPDFGNFKIAKGKTYDRYQGVDELMPFAQGVSAKSHDFDDDGNEKHTDYDRMLEIVVAKHGWRGHVGIEFEGSGSEEVGIQKTKALLERVRDDLSAKLQKKAEKKEGK